MVAARLPTIVESSRLIAEGKLSPTELIESSLDRAEGLNGELRAFIQLLPDRARKAAQAAEEEIRMGRRLGPLHGIPYALKDLYDVAGVPTTAHSKILMNHVAERDSEVTSRLESAGMILIGKLAMHEFAIGGPSWDLPWPPARNPWNTSYFTGGSSSGSGAAVAAGIVPLAMGTDTGGSVRIPASYCGCVGVKPTYGRVSRRGVIPLSFSMDHCGPLTGSVADAALVLQALAGYDPLDPTSSRVGPDDYTRQLEHGIKEIRIGYAREHNLECGIEPEEESALDSAAQCFRDLGAEVVEITLPRVELFHACGRAILYSEAFAVHQKNLQERPADYGQITRERLTLGAFVTGAQYVQAQRVRRRLIQQVNEVLQHCDVLLTAPVPGSASPLDKVDTRPWRKVPPVTTVFNVTGHPALCQPCGMSSDGLPLSLQLVGAPFAEAMILRVAHAYEQATNWHLKHPSEPAL